MRHHFVRAAWLTVCLASWVGVSSISDGSEETPPWNANPPIVTVKKELYRRHVRPRESVTASVDYVGAGPERREVQSEQTKSDVGDNVRARWSNDNGRTWTDFVTVQPSNNVDYGGVTVWEGEGCQVYDPAAGVLVQSWLRQIIVGGLYHCFSYSRYSRDQGRTWSEPQQFRYEDGQPLIRATPERRPFSTTTKDTSATTFWFAKTGHWSTPWPTATRRAIQRTTSVPGAWARSCSWALERRPQGLRLDAGDASRDLS